VSVAVCATPGVTAQNLIIPLAAMYTASVRPCHRSGPRCGYPDTESGRGEVWARSHFGERDRFNLMLPIKEDA